jgi:hypothetical protein
VLQASEIEAVWITDDADASLVPIPVDADARTVSDPAEVFRQGTALLKEWSSQSDQKRMLWLKLSSTIWSKHDSAIAVLEEIDEWMKPLWETIQSIAEAEPVRFLVTAARGRLLRERATASEIPAEASEESVHLPLIVFDSEQAGGERRFFFTQSADLPATLLDFFAISPPQTWEGVSFLGKISGSKIEERESLTYGSQGFWEAIRTQDFHLIRSEDPKNPGSKKHFLFLKPEDIWDWHDVSSQELAMTETLSQKMDASLNPAENEHPSDPAGSES